VGDLREDLEQRGNEHLRIVGAFGAAEFEPQWIRPLGRYLASIDGEDPVAVPEVLSAESDVEIIRGLVKKTSDESRLELVASLAEGRRRDS